MATRYGWMGDTDPRALRVWTDLQRRVSAGEKLAQVLEMAAMMMRADLDRARKDHPESGERELFLRAAAKRLGSDTVCRVYGWDPESGGAR